MNPAYYTIKYKQLALIILLILISAGIFSYITMPRQEDPDVNPPVAQVITSYPGANPLQVEQLVTTIIEQELKEISLIKRITSTSGKNFSSIMLELNHGIDTEKVWDEVQAKLSQVQEKLPAAANAPRLNTELIKTATSIIAVSGSEQDALNAVAVNLKTSLERLPAVATVEMAGASEPAILITVDDQKLAGHRPAIDQIIKAVQANNVSIPGSTLELGNYRVSLTTPNQYVDLTGLAKTVVDMSPQGWPLYLQDVAAVKWTDTDDRSLVRTNGQPAVILELNMKDRENVVKLGRQISAAVEQARQAAPREVAIDLIADQPGDVAHRLSTFSYTLLFGMLLVILIVLLAMGWRNALIVSLAIPLSVMLAFAGMGLWQVSLHQVSIAALVIALGILVDNAIVVNDNIYRHWQQGVPTLEACTKGLKEVAVPVLSSTLTTIAAFVPLIMMPGDVGQFIKAIPQVVSLTLLSSLLIAVTITPLTFYLLMKNKPSPGLAPASPGEHYPETEHLAGRKSKLVSDLYLHTLAQAMARPKTTLVIALFFLVASSLLLTKLGVEFFPPSDKNQALIQIAAPAGTGLETTDRIVREVEIFLTEQPQVKNYTAFVGRGVPKFYYNVYPSAKATNLSQVLVNLDPNQDLPGGRQGSALSGLATRWQNQLQNRLGEARIRVDLLEQGPPVGAPVAFRLLGPDLEVLAQLADRGVAILREIPGTTAQNHGLAEQELLLETVVHPDRAALVGLSRPAVAAALRFLNERQEITTIKAGTGEIPIMFTVTGPLATAHGLNNLFLSSPVTGEKVPLGQVAALRPAWQWTSITHWQNERAVFVYSYVESQTSANEIYTQAIPRLKSLDLPPGYFLEIGGQMEDQLVSFANLGQAGIIAVLLIYLILIFQFNSLVQPLLIVLSIPFTIVGAVAGLYLLGYPIGFMAFLGMVSLVGIVVNNAIVLVDFINWRRREGFSLHEAIFTAGRQRLRPILLTTATTIGGLLPLSLTGGNMWGPMGFAIIFGLAGSTLLTLVVLPALYVLVENRKTGLPGQRSQFQQPG